jgi:hypothetical protein
MQMLPSMVGMSLSKTLGQAEKSLAGKNALAYL